MGEVAPGCDPMVSVVWRLTGSGYLKWPCLLISVQLSTNCHYLRENNLFLYLLVTGLFKTQGK
jgi:hypothetical protein